MIKLLHFRFPIDKDIISYKDIMNICAAFESQAPDFADNEQRNVRRKDGSEIKRFKKRIC